MPRRAAPVTIDPEPSTRPYRPHGAGSVVKSTDRRGVVTFRPRVRRGERTDWGVGVSVTAERDAETARALALANLEDLRRSIAEQHPLDPAMIRMTLARWTREHWYPQLRAELPKESHHRTLRVYEWAMDSHVLPFIGHLRVAGEITVPAIQRWREELAAAGRTRNTIRWAEARLRQCLRAAVLAGYAVPEGVFLMKHVAVDALDRPFLTPEQVAALLGAIEDAAWRRLWRAHFGLATRYGEVAGLRWRDWRREKGTVAIVGQVDARTNRWRPRPKDGSRGTLPLTRDAAAALAEQWAATVAASGREPDRDAYVFARDGAPVRYGRALVQLKAAIERANAAGAGIDERAATHAFRHGHAQVLLEEGMPVALIGRKLRQRSEATTRAYLHGATAEGLQVTADAVDRRQGS
jgi:integrase